MRQYLILFAVFFLFACKKTDLSTTTPEDISLSAKADAPGNLHTRVLNSTLNFPWEIIWGPDNFIWFTEREGRVKRMNPQTGQVIAVATIAEVASTTNFNGLLGMALHPQFEDNPFVYLVYN